MLAGAHMPQPTSRHQRQHGEINFLSLSGMWVPETELKLSVLVARASMNWAILMAQGKSFNWPPLPRTSLLTVSAVTFTYVPILLLTPTCMFFSPLHTRVMDGKWAWAGSKWNEEPLEKPASTQRHLISTSLFLSPILSIPVFKSILKYCLNKLSTSFYSKTKNHLKTDLAYHFLLM